MMNLPVNVMNHKKEVGEIRGEVGRELPKKKEINCKRIVST
jgi:hypothetical protein